MFKWYSHEIKTPFISILIQFYFILHGVGRLMGTTLDDMTRQIPLDSFAHGINKKREYTSEMCITHKANVSPLIQT